MTDNEIIKALECCAKSKCKECSFNRHYDTKRTLCTLRLAENALDLINRQKAEIERYKGVIKLLEKDVATAKTEAIKEALREFNATLYPYRGVFIKGEEIMIIPMSDYDNILNEMMEEKDE